MSPEWTRVPICPPLCSGSRIETSISRISTPSWSPRQQAGGRSLEFDSQAEVTVIEDHASRILVDYQAQNKAFLVAAITADRDWSARVDGASTPIQVTALGQMGIELPAGSHRLVLEHRNPVLIWGALISGLALLACATPLITRTMRHGD